MVMLLIFLLGIGTFAIAMHSRGEIRVLRHLVDQLAQEVALLRAPATPVNPTAAAPTSSATAATPATPEPEPELHLAVPSRAMQPAARKAEVAEVTVTMTPARSRQMRAQQAAAGARNRLLVLWGVLLLGTGVLAWMVWRLLRPQLPR